MPQINLSPSPRGRRISRKEAAAYLGIAEDTLTKWASIGRPFIPHYKVGRKAVYDTADLDDYLARHRVNQASEAPA